MLKNDLNIAVSSTIFSIQTKVSDFVENMNSGFPSQVPKMTVKDFLEYSYENKTNLDQIWSQYNAQEKNDYESDYKSKNLPYIKIGTLIFYPTDKILMEVQQMTKTGQFLSQSDFGSFWSENYKKIIADINYSPEYSETKDEVDWDLKTIPQYIRVWIYMHSLDKIIDLSPFISRTTTNKGVGGEGMFSIVLDPFKSLKSAQSYANGFFEQFNIVTSEGNVVKNFLEKYVVNNDLVFIRFEKLKLEKDPMSENTELELEVSKSKLVNNDSNYNVWDMIGMVDSCNTSLSTLSTDCEVVINGRDFTKLFTEDGSYFLPLKWVEGSRDRWFYGYQEESEWFQRNVLTGNYEYFFNYGFRSIQETLWFVINVLSGMGVVNDELFAAYSSKRTKAYTIDDDKGVSKTQKVKGIWQIVKVFVESQLNNRCVVDHSIVNPDGSLMSFIQKICQAPFVEVLFDTYVDTLDVVVRQPPFNESAIKDVVDNKRYINIPAGGLFESSLSYDERIYSWYQVFPQNNYTGTSQFTSLAFVPIIYFNEYTKLWGNKKQQIQDIYLSLSAFRGVEGTNELNSFAAALLNDLLFVIETNIYLPFTRRGTLVINGDRRIKSGTFVKNEATNELFYVNNVTQDILYTSDSIQRITTLEVERGMYFPILNNSLGTTKERQDNSLIGDLDTSITPSYFKIARLQAIKEDIKRAEEAARNKSEETVSSGNSTPLDNDQFNYFLKRKMYGK